MLTGIWPPIYIETALLGMGLPSISNQQMLDDWSAKPAGLPGQAMPRPGINPDKQSAAESYLVWLEKGEVILGDLPRFLSVRANPAMQRIDGNELATAQANHSSGFLTASAVMRLARPGGAITVTAGMGGIRGAHKSDDLHCLTRLPVLLIAAAPKDVLDLSATLQYLIRQGTRVSGWQVSQCDGFLFQHPPVEVPTLKRLADVCGNQGNAGSLILNPLPAGERLTDENMLPEALQAGLAAKDRGESFHPAVNAALDRLSNGLSSMMQLRALLQNIHLAVKISEALTLAKDDEDNDSAR